MATRSLRHPVKLVVFDLGGVLVRIAASWAEAHRSIGLADEDSPSELEVANLLHQYGLGLLSTEDYLERVAQLPPARYMVDDVAAVHHAFSGEEHEGIQAVFDALGQAGVEVGILSNTNEAHWVRLRPTDTRAPEYPTLARARYAVASHLIGQAKPDREAYLAIEQLSGFSGRSILFFDDRMENVAGARAVGWRAELIDPHGPTDSQIVRVLDRYSVVPMERRD